MNKINKSNLVVETYNKIAQIYSKLYFIDLSDGPYIDKFLAKLPKGSKILDIGSGPGQFSEYIKSKGFAVQGIDLSPEMIKIANEKVPEVTFEIMDMRKLKFDENYFEGLFAAYSLIHIPSSEINKTLNEFKRVLKPDGYIMIIAQKGKSDQTVDEPLMKGEKTFINFFTKGKLQKYLKDAKFNVEYIEEHIQDTDGLSEKVIYVIAGI